MAQGNRIVNGPELRSWLAEPRTDLVAAVVEGIRQHVASLRQRGVDFYGYALLTGEIYDLNFVAVVTNTEQDVKVASTDDQYRYYRYSVDTWAHWDQDALAGANQQLSEDNGKFASLHTKDENNFRMDEFQKSHAHRTLEAFVAGLEAVKNEGLFGEPSPFLVVWISDSNEEVMADSVRRLNSEEVADDFFRERW